MNTTTDSTDYSVEPTAESLQLDYMTACGSVSSAKLSRHLATSGFGRLASVRLNDDGPTWVRVDNGRLASMTERDVRRFLCEEAEQAQCEDDVIDAILHSRSLTPALTKLPLLALDGEVRQARPVPLLRDEPHTVRFPFDNGIVTITADDMAVIPYAEQKGVIWESQVVPRAITVDPFAKGRFEQFCEQAFYRQTGTGAARWTDDFALTPEAAEQYRAFQGALGYLLHNYRDPANPRAVLFVDMDSDQSMAEGGNGKSLTLRVLKYLRDVLFQDGKRYGASREGGRFQFSNVTPTTQVVVLDDVQKSFNFATLFALLSGDMETERKGRDKTVIPSHRVPKVAITTNHLIPPSGASFERRLYIVEFGSYWTTAYRHDEQISDPLHMGCRLFESGFTEQDWQDAFNYLFRCVQLYLRDGVKQAPLALYRMKALRREMGAEFVDWAMDFFETYEKRNVDPQEGEYLSDLCKSMKVHSSDARCQPADFAAWLKRMGEQCGYEYNPHKADKGNTPTARRWRITDAFGRNEDAVFFVRR